MDMTTPSQSHIATSLLHHLLNGVDDLYSDELTSIDVPFVDKTMMMAEEAMERGREREAVKRVMVMVEVSGRWMDPKGNPVVESVHQSAMNEVRGTGFVNVSSCFC